MNHFSELQSQHEELLRRENAGDDILENVKTYIEDVRFKSSNVSSAQEREQLRANTRYWASYVYSQTNIFPNTELTPFSGAMMKETAVVNTMPKSIMWVGGGIATVVIILFAFLLFGGDGEAASSEETAALETESAIAAVTQTTAAVVMTIAPAQTSTPQVTVTPTAIPVSLQSLKIISSENVKEIQPLVTLTGHTGAVLDIDFNPNGQQLVSSGEDGTIILWGIDNNNLLSTHTIFQDWLQQSVTYNPSGKQVAIGGNDRVVTILNIVDALPFAQFTGHEGFVFGLDYTPDGLQLVSGDGNGVLKIWDVYSGGSLSTMVLGKNAILDLDFSQTQDTLAVANADDGFKLLAYPSLRSLCSLSDQAALTTAFANNGKFIVFGSDTGEIIQVDPASCRPLAATKAHTGAVNSVVLNDASDLMVSGGTDGIVFIMPGGISLTGHTDSVESVAINPAGTLIASASADGTIILWGIPSE